MEIDTTVRFPIIPFLKIFLVKIIVDLYCSVTLIRAGVAVQGPLESYIGLGIQEYLKQRY